MIVEGFWEKCTFFEKVHFLGGPSRERPRAAISCALLCVWHWKVRTTKMISCRYNLQAHTTTVLPSVTSGWVESKKCTFFKKVHFSSKKCTFYEFLKKVHFFRKSALFSKKCTFHQKSALFNLEKVHFFEKSALFGCHSSTRVWRQYCRRRSLQVVATGNHLRGSNFSMPDAQQSATDSSLCTAPRRST